MDFSSGPLGTLARTIRTPGYRRTLLARRIIAALLVAFAIVHVVRSSRASDPAIVTFARPVTAGSILTADDVTLTRVPASLVPENAFSLIDDTLGHVSTVHGSPGQPVSRSQVIGPELTAGYVSEVTDTGSGVTGTMVPVSLAEPDILPLLHPGDEISIVSTAPEGTDPVVIATGGRVVFSGDSESREGETVLVWLPEADAHTVASASLSLPLTVVLTGDRAG